MRQPADPLNGYLRNLFDGVADGLFFFGLPGVTAARLLVVSRVVAALAGGYAFVWGFVTLGIVLGMAAGASYRDAQTLVYLLAFIVFLVALLWAFATRSLLRAWGVLAGGGALMTGLAWLLAR